MCIILNLSACKNCLEAYKKEAKLNRSVNLGLYVFKLGAKYWQDVLNAGYRYNKFTNDCNGCKDVQSAIKACDRNRLIESKSALEDLMRIKKEFEEEGIIQKWEPVEEEEENYSFKHFFNNSFSCFLILSRPSFCFLKLRADKSRKYRWMVTLVSISIDLFWSG